LPDGTRVGKDAARPEACGTVDELNALLGLARAEGLSETIDRCLRACQHDLLAVGAELAAGGGTTSTFRPVDVKQIAVLETVIDQYQEALPPLAGFILPGGTRAAALLHQARTVCRRAERRIVSLGHDEDREISPSLLAYINRLSDLLFVLARTVNAEAGTGDVAWEKDRDG
jgi:cob(I)alamin adenosyltransferase